MFVELTLAIIWSLMVVGITIAPLILIIAGLTSFHKGESTHAQLVWVMTWLVVGICIGISSWFLDLDGGEPNLFEDIISLTLRMALIPCVPAVGGIFVVGQMIMTYGVCTEIT